MEEINKKIQIELLDFRQKQWKQWVEERRPFSVLFELTPKCNMNCIHCYLKNVHSSEQLSYKEIIKILDILFDKGILFLIFSGGEILTRKDFLDIYIYAKKRGFLIELFSNGLAFSDEIISVLKTLPPLYIDITLYGACEETYKKVSRVEGAFEKVMENCKKIKEAGINLSLRSPVLKETEAEMKEIEWIAKEMGVPFVCTFEIYPTIDRDSSPQVHQTDILTMLKYEFSDYYKQIYKKERKYEVVSKEIIESMKNKFVFSCNVGRNSFIIDYEGKMCPCMKLKHQGIQLLDNDFDKIWEKFGIYSRMIASNSYKCSSCDSRYYCDVCPAEMNFIYGDYEYRELLMCKAAVLRKEFYQKEKSYEELFCDA